MKIDEVIKRYSDNAEYERTHGNLQECLEFEQLVKWLKELRAYRRMYHNEHESDYLREQTEWIPCSERLPENDEDVLTTNGIGINICWIDTDDHKWRLRNDDYIMDSVIAWMPLPEQYKE